MVSPNVQFILLFLIIFFSSQFLSEDHNTCAFVIEAWFVAQMLNLGRITRPTALSSHVAAHSALIFSLLSVPLCLLVQGTAWHQKVIYLTHIVIFLLFHFRTLNPVSELRHKLYKRHNPCKISGLLVLLKFACNFLLLIDKQLNL
jgi:hypothetical protein